MAVHLSLFWAIFKLTLLVFIPNYPPDSSVFPSSSHLSAQPVELRDRKALWLPVSL